MTPAACDLAGLYCLGMGQNYFGQAMNMGSAFQQQGQGLLNQGQQMAGQVQSPQQQWLQLMSMGQNLQQQVHSYRAKQGRSKTKGNN